MYIQILALKYLYTVTADEYSDLDVREFTINNDPNYIYTELVRANYDMVCFSCYIWNIEQIKVLAADLKKAMPDIKIVLGGPEVSFSGATFMQENTWADFTFAGRGVFFLSLHGSNRDQRAVRHCPGPDLQAIGKNLRQRCD